MASLFQSARRPFTNALMMGVREGEGGCSDKDPGEKKRQPLPFISPRPPLFPPQLLKNKVVQILRWQLERWAPREDGKTYSLVVLTSSLI